MRDWFKKFLEKLAKANEEAFKGQRMDCCDLNRSNNTGSVNNNKRVK